MYSKIIYNSRNKTLNFERRVLKTSKFDFSEKYRREDKNLFQFNSESQLESLRQICGSNFELIFIHFLSFIIYRLVWIFQKILRALNKFNNKYFFSMWIGNSSGLIGQFISYYNTTKQLPMDFLEGFTFFKRKN